MRCHNLSEVRRLITLECGGGNDRRLVICMLNSYVAGSEKLSIFK